MKNRLVLLYSRWAPVAVMILSVASGCGRKVDASAEVHVGAQAATGQEPTPDQVVAFVMDRLHRHVQPNGPVAVFRDVPDDAPYWAYTERAGPGWQIHLATAIRGEFLIDVLEHEWAHTLSWSDDPEYAALTAHGAQWGIELSRCYDAVLYNVDVPDYLAVPLPEPAGSNQ